MPAKLPNANSTFGRQAQRQSEPRPKLVSLTSNKRCVLVLAFITLSGMCWHTQRKVAEPAASRRCVDTSIRHHEDWVGVNGTHHVAALAPAVLAEVRSPVVPLLCWSASYLAAESAAWCLLFWQLLPLPPQGCWQFGFREDF
ncbi:hypothetical protein AMATHDRAFT_3239 [Amanita thiersii Skay4041]|uniref:Uncharacterized protein n=1 Tax=Amanita thiersii Skay4041 TaxID=703135 RepID=A0A2A9NJT7_9AGAR|nr:hypothetical protein AMATHDRAFT_3239 [Amanita thiersii Skay4041]